LVLLLFPGVTIPRHSRAQLYTSLGDLSSAVTYTYNFIYLSVCLSLARGFSCTHNTHIPKHENPHPPPPSLHSLLGTAYKPRRCGRRSHRPHAALFPCASFKSCSSLSLKSHILHHRHGVLVIKYTHIHRHTDTDTQNICTNILHTPMPSDTSIIAICF